MMFLCCGAPILLFVVITLLGTSFSGIKVFLAGVLPFICPIMMLIMMPMMFVKHKESGEFHEHKPVESNEDENNSNGNYLKLEF